MENNGMMLDWETADRITLLNLISARKSLQEELERAEAGEWIHPNDEIANMKYIKAMTTIIDYFGGEEQVS